MRSSLRYSSIALILVLITVLLAEFVLQFAVPFLPQPLSSVLEESRRVRFSNTRISGLTKARLPKMNQANIVVVGDSMPFGQLVREKDSFPQVLFETMKDTGVSLTVPGLDPAGYQELVEVGCAYRPKVLLYVLFMNDYWHSNDVAAKPLKCLQRDSLSEGKFWVSEIGWGERIRDQIDYLRYWSLVRKVPNVVFSDQSAQGDGLLRKTKPIPWMDGDNFYSFAGADYWDPVLSWEEPAVQKAAKRNLAYIEQVQALASERNFKLVVVLLPSKEMVYSERYPHPERITRPSHFETLEWMQNALTHKNIYNVSLLKPLQDRASHGEKLFFSVDGHFNELGHRRTAESIAQYLDKQLSLSE